MRKVDAVGILAKLFGTPEGKPEPVVITEVDIESDEYKQQPWPVPWESDSSADDFT